MRLRGSDTLSEPMPEEEMKRFWDRRARENAYYFVDNRLEFDDPDLDGFWSEGTRVLDELLDPLGLAIMPDDRVVEIGCGVGRLTRVISERAAGVVALDVSEAMLELARERNPTLSNVEWILGDGRSLAGVDDESADACVSFVVFQHIPDPEITLAYIRDMGRILRPGGWSAFQVSNAPEVHRRPSLGERLRAWVRPLVGGPRGQSHPAWRGSAVDLASLREAAALGGLEVERVVGEGTQFCFAGLRKPRR